MTPDLHALHEVGAVGPLDLHLARTLGRISGEDDPWVLLAVALASRATADGHVCVDLRQRIAGPLSDAAGETVAELTWPTLSTWTAALRSSPILAQEDPLAPAPLVLDDSGRLYLRRYWSYQRDLAASLRARARGAAEPVDEAALGRSLRRLFPGPSEAHVRADDVDWQAVAAVVAASGRLTVVSGGPGTGKTSTVVRIVAALAEQALAAGRPAPEVVLLAPTGKAAARLVESVRRAKAGLDSPDDARAAIPEAAATIHRALGARLDRPTAFRHDANDPLPADVVVVDEASMVDLALMSKLVAAVRPTARLVLLGDRDQLASVEAGAILGDICAGGGPERYSAPLRARVARVTGADLPLVAGHVPPTAPGFADSVVTLTRSWRFGTKSGIGALARAVNAGDGAGALAILDDPVFPDVALSPLSDDGRPGAAFAAAVRDGFRGYLAARAPEDRLARLADFRVLCAHRSGPTGVERVNRLVEAILRADGALRGPDGAYEGRPVLVTANDYTLGLFNGDMGVLAADSAAGGALRAFFPAPDGAVRRVLPARLPAHETAWAMTVHKSQGSEFDGVLLLLPAHASRILSRELVYTGLTRARVCVRVFGGRDVIVSAAARRVERASGLQDALWDRSNSTASERPASGGA